MRSPAATALSAPRSAGCTQKHVLDIERRILPLLATEPGIDAATDPWLCQKVLNNLGNGQLIVFLNDFVDNCMVSSAINVTRQRLQSRIQAFSKTGT